MYNKVRAEFLIKQELTLFPVATMADLYKLFYQNCRGSQHFIGNLAFLKRTLIKEIDEMKPETYIFPSYDISYVLQVSRISLITIINGEYEISYIADRFLALTDQTEALTTGAWFDEWKELEGLILQIKPDIVTDLAENDLLCDSTLHHSEAYKNEYNPHYRICDIKL